MLNEVLTFFNYNLQKETKFNFGENMKKLFIILPASLALFMTLQNEAISMETIENMENSQNKNISTISDQHLDLTTPYQSPQQLALNFIESEDDRSANTNPVDSSLIDMNMDQCLLYLFHLTMAQ